MPDIKFRLAQHSIKSTEIVEIIWDGNVCAAIYPHTDPDGDGVRIISAHLLNRSDGVYFSIDDSGPIGIPAITVLFKPGEYRILDGKIVKTGDSPEKN